MVVIDFDEVYPEKDDSICQNDSVVNQMSVNLFKKRLSGYGILVRRCDAKGRTTCIRRLAYLGKFLYLSSFKGAENIPIDEIRSCRTLGKKLIIETRHRKTFVLELPKLSDALAFKNVLG